MTVPVALLRHGRTGWNESGRIQGRTDVGLSAAGRAALERVVLPAALARFDWYVTPLARTAETAEALGIAPVGVEPRLVELDWGDWEGSTRDALGARLGAAFHAMGRRGLDFRPANGESSRELRARLIDWLGEVGTRGRPVGAVTHKGVIQMALALATGWDLVARRPHRLRWECAHLFAFDAQAGTLAIEQLNIEPAPRAPRGGGS